MKNFLYSLYIKTHYKIFFNSSKIRNELFVIVHYVFFDYLKIFNVII